MNTNHNNNSNGSVPHKLGKGLVKSISNIHEEFSKGFDFASQIKNGVSIFGGGKLEQENIHCQKAKELANLLARAGFTVITGGGPGIMEAANHGANDGGGESLGLNIIIPDGQAMNKYVTRGMALNYFFSRKVMFAVASDYYIFFPGGFGTLDEFFEIVNIIHNKKINNPPLLVAVGRDYWQSLIDWIKKIPSEKYGTIEIEAFKMFNVVETAEEAFESIRRHQKLNQ